MLNNYKSSFETYANDWLTKYENPKNLYAPINYSFSNGGKRIRAIIVLLLTQGFGRGVNKGLIGASAIEFFHCFTLIHDDIMDNSFLRRGLPTVHKKWNTSTAILAGDTLQILAFKILAEYPKPIYQKLVKRLTDVSILICEGQQYDMDFEKENSISYKQYLKLIQYKTAILLGLSAEFSAIICKQNKKKRKLVFKIGYNLGIAFQLQDDYLDIYASESFGKQIGGDILNCKKTALFVKTLEELPEHKKSQFIKDYNTTKCNETEKIKTITTYFKSVNIKSILKSEIAFYLNKSYSYLKKVPINKACVKEIKYLINTLSSRNT